MMIGFILYIKRIKKSCIFFAACCICLLACGGSSFDRKFHKVTEIVNGNTVVVNHRVTIKLIGVGDTRDGKQFLEDYVLGKQVRVRFDRKKRESVSARPVIIYAYVLTQDRISVNAELLKRNYSSLDLKYLNDSLLAFTNYSKGILEQPRRQANSKRPISPDIPKQTGSTTKSFSEIVRHTEQAVFAIYTLDENGDGVSYGTGFFIHSNGLAVSNYHVMEGGTKWYAKTINEDVYEITEIIEHSRTYDFIRFRVTTGKPVTYLETENRLPEKGEDIFVLGNPRGLESTLTRGVVSAIRSINSTDDFIQIDAAISPGSSGSPVLNMQGRVIGIATLKKLDCEACNFAINIKLAL